MGEIGSILVKVVAFLVRSWERFDLFKAVVFLVVVATIAMALFALVRWLRRPIPPIPPFLVARQQAQWQQWLRDQVADASRVTWVSPGQVPSYEANGYVVERKAASGAEIRTRDLASSDLAAHGYAVLMTMRRR